MKLYRLFISLCIFFSVVSIVRAESIEDFSSAIAVEKDGTISVQEDITYDFGSLERHGILRFIPLRKTNKEGKQFRMDIDSKLSSSVEENKIRFRLGDANKYVTGIQQYTIPYTVAGALTYFSDHDELYWNVTGNDWTIPIKNATATVTLPTQENVSAVCYRGVSGSTTPCEVSVEGATVTATAPQLGPGEGMTIAVRFPKGIVAVREPREVVSFWDTFIGKITRVGIMVGLLWWYLLYGIWIAVKWFRYGRDPASKEVSAWFEAPFVAGRSLTPGETGALVDEVVDLRDVLAAIVHLAQRGYLVIDERSKNDFYLIRTKKESDHTLLPYEQSLLSDLFDGETEVRVKNRDRAVAITNAQEAINEKLLEDKLFVSNPKTIRAFYTGVAGVALFTFNFFLAFVAFTFGRNMARKTPDGAQAAAVGRSLKNFLTSQEAFLNFQGNKKLLFEKLLAYAVAFGVEKNWASRFKELGIAQPSWFHSYNDSFSVGYLASSLSHSMSSLNYAVTPTSSSSGFSSGFSGGSSGGGGGGGGGGSW